MFVCIQSIYGNKIFISCFLKSFQILEMKAKVDQKTK